MAATDLASIIRRWQTVLEAAPLSLVRTQLPFTHDRQPNGLVANSYWIDDAGVVSRTSGGHELEYRIDRLRIWVAKPLAFAGHSQMLAMHTLADTIYRHLSADGRVQGWNVEADSRRISQPDGLDLIVGEFGFRVDYDFDARVQ